MWKKCPVAVINYSIILFPSLFLIIVIVFYFTKMQKLYHSLIGENGDWYSWY